MRLVVTTLIAAVLLGTATAQERVPQEKAQKIAELLVKHSAKLTDLPLKVEPATDKAFAIRHEELGAMVIPDQALTVDVLSKAGKQVMPVGQLWMRGLTPVAGGSPTPNDRLRLISVTIGDNEVDLPFFLLGARKNGKGKLELVVYAKAKEPLTVLPLEAIDSTHELPIQIEGKKVDDKTGQLTLNVLGKYSAKLTVAGQQN